MRYKLTLFLFLLNSSCYVLWAQGVVSQIEFEGLKKTKVSFLSSFLQTTPENIPNDSILMADVQRLKNIAGIGNATYRVETVAGKKKVIFTIEEVSTLLPIINFGGIRGNFWYQLGFSDINWMGRGQYLSLHYQNNDRRHSGQLYYRVPYFKNSAWGYSLSLNKWASREPLFFEEGAVDYEYDNNSIGFTLIRHFGINRNLEAGGTYFIEKYRKSEEQVLENPPGPDGLRQPKLLTKWEYRANFLDYHFFYLKGISWHITLQNVYNTLDQTLFNSLQFQGRQYFRLGNYGNLATRLRLAISTNNNSPFAPFVVDSHVNLRGVGNRIDRGTAQAVWNIEYRQTVFEAYPWGAQLVVFSDLGTWRNPGGKLKDLFNTDQFRHFVGGGFRFIYNRVYGATLRVDYGIDVYNTAQRGFVIGLGQYF